MNSLVTPLVGLIVGCNQFEPEKNRRYRGLGRITKTPGEVRPR